MSDQSLYATVRQVTLPVGVKATHETRNGNSHTLQRDKPCLMTQEDAYTFLADPNAFLVKEANRVENPDHNPDDPESTPFIIQEGDVVTPVSTKTVEGGRVELDDDEVVAKLEELAAPALLKRCKRLKGSESFKASTAKKDLITFLINNKPSREAGVSRGSEGLTPELPKSTLDNVLDMSDLMK